MKRFFYIITILFIFFMLVLTSVYTVAYFTPIPIINGANKYEFLDSNNQKFSASSDKWAKLEDISPNLINATVALEDKNFYNHKGFDYLRIGKSLWNNLTTKTVQGASTITQQLAKNLFLTFDQTWERKIKEAWLTVRIETQYTKDEILEVYLNTINYGGIFGIENASYFYFNKSSKDLTLAEATILAGIPKSPSYYSPITNQENALNRQKVVLNSMINNNYITKENKEEALREKLVYYGALSTDKLKTLMYFQNAVMDELKSIKNLPSSFLDIDGIKIYTTLDIDAQKIMEDSLKYIKNDAEVALVLTNPDTGAVRGLIGGKNYALSEYNRALYSKRQVGSSIKPFLYYAALENGFTASSTFTSEETTFVFGENELYSPHNYGNLYGNKEITMAAAIAYSDNIYAVKTHLFLGEDVLVNTLKRVGIDSKAESLPSLALGSTEINLLDMIEGYQCLANLGYKISPYFIEKVEDANGNVLYKHEDARELVLDPSITFILNELLTGTYASELIDYTYPTCIGFRGQISKKYAIKSGTTDTDNLLFGYNPDYLLGAWIGFDNNQKTNNDNSYALKQIWIEVMEKCSKENNWYDIPDNVVGVITDPISGKLATNDSDHKKILYYINGTQPK